MGKVCFTCQTEKPLDSENFNNDKKAKDGFRASCKPCLKAKNYKWRMDNIDRAHATANSEQRKAWHNEYRRGRKAERAKEARKYRAKNLEKYRAYHRKHYAENREDLLAYRAEYIKKNPWFNRAAASRHRALILQRTAKWADREAIKEVYKNCPDGMVVDHVIPLRGKFVSGLHVEKNLQYLLFKDNAIKGNKYDPVLAWI